MKASQGLSLLNKYHLKSNHLTLQSRRSGRTPC